MDTSALPRCALYHEVTGTGVPILLIPPSGATASTWGRVVEELATIGQVVTYDRRGYTRSGGAPVHSASTHTEDAAALLASLGVPPAIVVGTSAGATIAIDLAVRHPQLVRAVVAHEAAWRAVRHLPNAAQIAALTKIARFELRGRHADAVEALLRGAYSYRDGGTAWDTFPAEWRHVARDNARAALADFRNSVGNYPSASDLATITAPVVCTYGARSPDYIVRVVLALAAAIPTGSARRIEGAGHAAPFDAPSNFVQVIVDAL
jgi:pimeloyl-ACP methyl ester carboxylesterase